MDMGYAQSMLTDSRKGKENPAVSSPSREAYQRKLAEALNMNRTRILAFKNKPPAPVDLYPKDFFSSQTQDKPAKPRRHIPQVRILFCLVDQCCFTLFVNVCCVLTVILYFMYVCRPQRGHWMLRTLSMITTSICWIGEVPMYSQLLSQTQFTYGMLALALLRSWRPLMMKLDL